MKATWMYILKRQNQTVLHREETYLFLEISDCIFICICEEVQNVMFYVIFFQVIHQVRSIALLWRLVYKRIISFWRKKKSYKATEKYWQIKMFILWYILPIKYYSTLSCTELHWKWTTKPENSKSLNWDVIII